MKEFAACRQGIEHPRTGGAELHDCPRTPRDRAVPGGGQGAISMAKFALAKKEFLRAFLRLGNGPPGHETVSRLFHQLDPDQFSSVFQRFMERFSKEGPVKGKFQRSTWNNAFLSRLLRLL